MPLRILTVTEIYFLVFSAYVVWTIWWQPLWQISIWDPDKSGYADLSNTWDGVTWIREVYHVTQYNNEEAYVKELYDRGTDLKVFSFCCRLGLFYVTDLL